METLERIKKSPHRGVIKKAFNESVSAKARKEILYPDSDGEPMSDNTLHYQWIVKIVENLDNLYLNVPNVFVAGDLLWYPVEGRNDIRIGPDAMVVFGRPKGHRGSYKTWVEDNIAPQVVFEIRSPRNTSAEMAKKLQFYDRYDVEEYYLYDPDRRVLNGWIRSSKGLTPIVQMNGWISPRLAIRFIMKDDLVIMGTDNREFLPPSVSIETERQRAETERQRADEERQRAETERQRAETERQRADEERQRAETERKLKERLAAKLRELGIEPDL